jgi:hypothetical protein
VECEKHTKAVTGETSSANYEVFLLNQEVNQMM